MGVSGVTNVSFLTQSTKYWFGPGTILTSKRSKSRWKVRNFIQKVTYLLVVDRLENKQNAVYTSVVKLTKDNNIPFRYHITVWRYISHVKQKNRDRKEWISVMKNKHGTSNFSFIWNVQINVQYMYRILHLTCKEIWWY